MKTCLSKYLDSNLVVFLDATHPKEAIESLIELLVEKEKIQDQKSFYSAIMEREKIVSTAIGMGVAIPHAKLPSYEDFFIAIGILKQAIHWGSAEDPLVRLIFMIGGPDDKQTEYLQLLSHLTLVIKDEKKRKKLLTSNSRKDIIHSLIT